MNINLNLYKYFYVVAKCLSYTKAAEELMVSQPSLSYSIKTLEEQLNIKLVKRCNVGIELTKEGENLYNDIKPLIETFEKLDQHSDNISGDIIIGTRTMYALKYLPHFTQIINRIYPELNIVVKIRTIEELHEGLLNNEFDLIIDENNYSDLNISSSLLKDGVTNTGFIVGKDNYINYKDKTITLNDLKDKLIAVGTNQYTKDFEKMYPNIKIIKVNSTPLLLNRIQKEDLIALTNLKMIENEISKKMVSKIETNVELPKTQMSISSLKTRENIKINKIKEFFMNYTSTSIEDFEEKQ